ncbi:SDR family NAD(P)-dependent oxidoreductase [Desulfobulbus sp. AH-315-M07]|nr:SDR family NAD(P)-dependent oxidoreductase [Desulfobulbus sp. AH-315-M07]
METARGLAELGATVIITGRSPERTEAAVRDIRESTGNANVTSYMANFSAFEEVRSLADRVLSDHEALHVLVNNAGLWNTDRRLSRDGFEETLAVNHFAPFLLTLRLRELLEKSAPARIVHVSSRRHIYARSDAFDDLNMDRSYDKKGVAAYDRSKLANILFSNALGRRLEGSGVTSNAVHPGSVATSITRGSLIARIGQAVIRPFLKSPKQGAATSLHVATSPELTNTTAKYFANCAETKPSPEALDQAAAERLWELSERITG